MSYNYYNVPAKSISYGGSRTPDKIKYIVIHYTANKTDTAKANANYFSPKGSNTRQAGAHYFVDKTSVYQTVDDLKIAYAVGGTRYTNYKETGGARLYGVVNNTNSISIEMCSDNGMIAEATVSNVVELTKKLMDKYKIPLANVIRHFDVNGKPCPGWEGWTGKNSVLWTAFKTRLEKKQVTTPTVNPATPAGSGEFKIRVKIDNLNIRKGPGVNYPVVSVIAPNVYTIVETKKNGSTEWGRLKSGIGWISLGYVQRL